MRKIIWVAGIVMLTGFYATAQTTDQSASDPLLKENVAPQQQHNCGSHHSGTSQTETSVSGVTVTETSSTQQQEGNTEMKSCSGAKGKSCCQGKTDKSCCQHQSKTEVLKSSAQEAPNSDQKVSTDTTTPQE